jgi:anti-sigma regulatory factor (Ser/Thr protein kinase)
VTASSAGHLPALLVRQDGTAGRLQVPVSVPLGVGGIAHQETTLPVPPRSTLVLYTDGLIEIPGSDIDSQINRLESELHISCATTSSLGQAADRILATLLPDPGEPDDDVTLLLTRTPAAPLATAQTMLRPEPQQVAAGRQFTRDTLTAWQHTDLAGTACLLVSEMLTNAVRHGRRPIGLRLHATPSEITAKITDDDPQRPQLATPDSLAESGRGLTVVEALATAWGTWPSSAGKTVWFTLATDSPARISTRSPDGRPSR